MNKVVFVATALVLVPLTLSSQEVQDRKDREPAYVEKDAAPDGRVDDQSKSTFRDRVAQAIETVEDACAADFDHFCGTVTPGGGRIALCIRAHDDQLSNTCRLALYRVARTLKSGVDRVAETCWNEFGTSAATQASSDRAWSKRRTHFPPRARPSLVLSDRGCTG